MSITGHCQREQEYGYLSYLRHVVLGLYEVDPLVYTVTEWLSTRGLTTPLIFSGLALDVNSPGVRRLVQAFLRTCVSLPAPDAGRTWPELLRPQDLPCACNGTSPESCGQCRAKPPLLGYVHRV